MSELPGRSRWPAGGLATLAGLTLVHALVDLFAAAVQPLWPDFQRTMGLGDAGIQVAYLAWSFATSFSQLAFGFHLTPGIVLTTLLFSVAMGLVGGFLPSVRAAKLEIVDALRAA